MSKRPVAQSKKDIVPFIAKNETELRPSLTLTVSELNGQITLPLPSGPFTLTARADRIDISPQKTATIIDYKTGTVTYGQSFNINASLATGYHWGNWTGSFTTDTQNYTFTIGDQDYDITANGIPNTYTIAYDANGGNNPPSNQTKTYNRMNW